jgi:hypothetical protein
MQRFNKALCFDGEPGGNRTRDHRIKSAMLYQLSYRPAPPDKLLLQDIIHSCWVPETEVTPIQ